MTQLKSQTATANAAHAGLVGKKTAQRWSLRRSLIAMLLTITLSIWGFSGIVVYIEADQESKELFDQSLAETAHLLLTLADHEVSDKPTLEHPLSETNVEKHNQYLLLQIWDASGKLMYKNQAAPLSAISTEKHSGFGWTQLEGQAWRTYSIWNNSHQLQIQVAEPTSHRKDISGRFAYKLLLFALLVLPLMTAGIWLTINRLFRALQESADQVAKRTPNDLEKVVLTGAPTELHSLLTAINHLFERVSHAMDQEQRFTANASHELRTPLAAIKANLQVIQRARNDAERQEAIDGLLISVDRATRLVEQLMVLSRLDPQHGLDPALRLVDLADYLEKQLPEWQQLAAKHDMIFHTQLASAPCMINPDSLQILLRNLLDNALRYTPANGEVLLSCGMQEGSAYLQISDTGPGIPPAMYDKVLERFFRLANANASGSGLGLSIVKNIAVNHAARLELGPGLHGMGLSVSLYFPPVQ